MSFFCGISKRSGILIPSFNICFFLTSFLLLAVSKSFIILRQILIHQSLKHGEWLFWINVFNCNIFFMMFNKVKHNLFQTDFVIILNIWWTFRLLQFLWFVICASKCDFSWRDLLIDLYLFNVQSLVCRVQCWLLSV